jgi:hypothetical protein
MHSAWLVHEQHVHPLSTKVDYSRFSVLNDTAGKFVNVVHAFYINAVRKFLAAGDK